MVGSGWLSGWVGLVATEKPGDRQVALPRWWVGVAAASQVPVIFALSRNRPVGNCGVLGNGQISKLLSHY